MKTRDYLMGCLVKLKPGCNYQYYSSDGHKAVSHVLSCVHDSEVDMSYTIPKYLMNYFRSTKLFASYVGMSDGVVTMTANQFCVSGSISTNYFNGAELLFDDIFPDKHKNQLCFTSDLDLCSRKFKEVVKLSGASKTNPKGIVLSFRNTPDTCLYVSYNFKGASYTEQVCDMKIKHIGINKDDILSIKINEFDLLDILNSFLRQGDSEILISFDSSFSTEPIYFYNEDYKKSKGKRGHACIVMSMLKGSVDVNESDIK